MFQGLFYTSKLSGQVSDIRTLHGGLIVAMRPYRFAACVVGGGIESDGWE